MVSHEAEFRSVDEYVAKVIPLHNLSLNYEVVCFTYKSCSNSADCWVLPASSVEHHEGEFF